jgi:hypothetical protein
MRLYKLRNLHYILSCLLLVGMIRCKCKPPVAPTFPLQEDKPAETPTPPKGIWHTGQFDKEEITPIVPQASKAPQLYQHTFQVYRVKHDGSCGYRSFIPILLAEILVQDKWKKWLEDMRTTFYEPAKTILQTINLSGTRYAQFSPTDHTDKLLTDIKDLLQKLSQEPAPRPLEEFEIQLLVAFLRQTILMNWILRAHAGLEFIRRRNPTTRVTLTQKIDDFFDYRRDPKSFWADEFDFFIFYLPAYIGLLKHNNPSSYCIHYYPHPNINAGKPTFIREEDCVRATIKDLPNMGYTPDQFPQQPPPIWLYHHDNIYFEYLVCKEVDRNNP